MANTNWKRDINWIQLPPETATLCARVAGKEILTNKQARKGGYKGSSACHLIPHFQFHLRSNTLPTYKLLRFHCFI